MEYQNCYDCALKGGYMCSVKNPDDPWEQTCCPEGSREEACIASSSVKCTAAATGNQLI